MVDLTLPIPFADLERITKLPRRSAPRGPLTSDEVRQLMDAARICTNSKSLDWAFFAISQPHSCTSSDLLLTAIDPDTRDSTVHAAASNPSTAALASVRSLSRGLLGSLRHAVLTHQNAAGDTAMHVAARAGVQDVVTAVYRVFHDDSVPGPGDDWREEGVEFPAEEWEYEEDMREAGAHVPGLMFLLTKNAAGLDAAAEARAAGHEDVAVWLDNVVARLDPDNERAEEEGRKWMEAVLKRAYNWDTDGRGSCLD